MGFYIIGDLHGSNKDLIEVINKLPKEPCTVICAGDVGLEYGNAAMLHRYAKNTRKMKRRMEESGHTWYVMRGNHDNCYYRDHYADDDYFVTLDGFLTERQFPRIRYFPDQGWQGYLYDASNIYRHIKTLILPGAYSVDKYYRLQTGCSWNPDEQLTEDERDNLLYLVENDDYYDIVVSHTYPRNLEPKIEYLFMSGLDQNLIDKTTEDFLQKVSDKIEFTHWFFGHLHDDKELDEKHTLLYHNPANIYDYIKR